MKTDIKVNFTILETIIYSIDNYIRFLEDAEIAMNQIQGIIDRQTGQAIEALQNQHNRIINNIKNDIELLRALRKNIVGYCDAMEAIISPRNRSETIPTLVDSTDMYEHGQS